MLTVRLQASSASTLFGLDNLLIAKRQLFEINAQGAS
jgi:hypothetical protein